MTNAKKEAILFTLNLIRCGMSVSRIEKDVLLDRIECRPEVIEYYEALAESMENGTEAPIKPDFKALKIEAIKAENAKRLENAQQAEQAEG